MDPELKIMDDMFGRGNLPTLFCLLLSREPVLLIGQVDSQVLTTPLGTFTPHRRVITDLDLKQIAPSAVPTRLKRVHAQTQGSYMVVFHDTPSESVLELVEQLDSFDFNHSWIGNTATPVDVDAVTFNVQTKEFQGAKMALPILTFAQTLLEKVYSNQLSLANFRQELGNQIKMAEQLYKRLDQLKRAEDLVGFLGLDPQTTNFNDMSTLFQQEYGLPLADMLHQKLVKFTRLTKLTQITSLTLLKLPQHLKLTAIAMLRLRKATAGEVSRLTTRTRGLESRYLNDLADMGFLWKEQEGRRAWFSIKSAAPTPGTAPAPPL
jgi:hypothetical protein